MDLRTSSPTCEHGVHANYLVIFMYLPVYALDSGQILKIRKFENFETNSRNYYY